MLWDMFKARGFAGGMAGFGGVLRRSNRGLTVDQYE